MKTPVVCTKCNSVCYSEVGLCRGCKPRAVRDCSAEYHRLISRLKEKGLYEQYREKNRQRSSEYNKKYSLENRARINENRRERYRVLHPIKERTNKSRYIPSISRSLRPLDSVKEDTIRAGYLKYLKSIGKFPEGNLQRKSIY